MTGREVRIDQWNAFDVNRAGIDSTRFPLSIEVVPPRAGEPWIVHGTASTVYDIVDALPWAENVALLNVGQNSWLDEDLRSLPPHEIAEEQNVPAIAHDIGTVAPLLVLARQDLRPFLADWTLYAVDIVDWDGERSPETVVDAVTSGTGFGTHLHGDDDCYVTVRSRDSSVAPRVFARLMALFAASALGIEDGGTITEPSWELCAGLLERSPFWTGRVTKTEPYGVEIGLAPQGWRPNDPGPRAFPVLVSLDRVTGEWNGAGD
ncbi:hypothetical protein NLX83_33160 [Allokutzneria sp. A3M-2-11 16]|uniref:hypothetical protein n=1 Tax=Allokutzneria sp. A3M-2-11 16 TaxID=2962043 RepID=UPI0020B715E4|nr:hypothetical protein [Allokutzneria sp. A3M-2-11 16]MCP3804133.1 hypothetical protein [Allokutzneria sp. A3M-2-11 16]